MFRTLLEAVMYFDFFSSQINELLSFEVISTIDFLRDGHEQQYGRFIGKANIACRIKEDYMATETNEVLTPSTW